VLVESNDPALAISDFRHFAEEGLDVALCSGPDGAVADCPLARGEPCELAAGADAILFDLPAGHAPILQAAARKHRATPVVVGAAAGSAEGLPEGCDVLPAHSSVKGQIGMLRRAALAGRRRRERG
jgi:hypothetical protein